LHAANQSASREEIRTDEVAELNAAINRTNIFVKETCGSFQHKLVELEAVLQETCGSFQQQLVEVETLIQARDHRQIARQTHVPDSQQMESVVSQDGLSFHILGASGLKNMDWGPTGKSDPYCMCQLKGKPEGGKIQTEVCKNTLEPVWNMEAKFEQFVPGDTLVFEVYDQDFGKQDDFLGKVELHSDQFYPQGFSGNLPLEDSGNSARVLRLEIPSAPQVVMRAVDDGTTDTAMEVVVEDTKESAVDTMRQDLECLTDAIRREFQRLQEDVEMLAGQMQQGGGGQPGGPDMMQLVEALDEEAGKRYETDELLKQEMVEASNRLDQLWQAVEAIIAQSQPMALEVEEGWEEK